MVFTEYRFKTVWRVGAPLAAAHSAIEDVHSWRRWWPALVDVSADKPAGDLVGSQAAMIWQATLGYKLHINITIASAFEMSDITFTATGDLVGDGSWLFEQKNESTMMTITWHVRTTKWWMNVLAPVLRPVFIASHHALMRSGEQGLNRYLQSTTPAKRVYS